MIPVNIKEKACQRVFKRGAAKVEVWSKGGFLRGDTLLGTATGNSTINSSRIKEKIKALPPKSIYKFDINLNF